MEDFYRHLTGIIIGQQLEVQMECVKVIAAEGSFKNSTQLIVITRGFQFLGCASNCKIIDKDLALLHGSLSYPAQFPEFEISKMLHAYPDAGP